MMGHFCRSLLLLLLLLVSNFAEANFFDFCRSNYADLGLRQKITAQALLSDEEIVEILGLEANLVYRAHISSQGGLTFPTYFAATRAIQHLADVNLSAAEKAARWQRFCEYFKSRGIYFISTFHHGSDGSFAFQGGDNTKLLVIRPDGSIYRGTAQNHLTPNAPWPAEYTGFTQILPAQN